jgi:hypothetical protein
VPFNAVKIGFAAGFDAKSVLPALSAVEGSLSKPAKKMFTRRGDDSEVAAAAAERLMNI